MKSNSDCLGTGASRLLTQPSFSLRQGACCVLTAAVLLAGLGLQAAPKRAVPQAVVGIGVDGGLEYGADAEGNRMPDFSYCGYAQQERAIPDAPVQVVVAPAKGDSTERIQRALDYVASLPADTNGIRGAVLLLKGRHEVYGGLKISASGVVLRGQGMGKDGTLLVAAGLDRRTLLRFIGKNDCSNPSGKKFKITDAIVPVGARSFHVEAGSGLKVGDSIQIVRPCSEAWIEKLSATEYGGSQGDWRLTWKPGSRDITWDRVVKAVADNEITVDAPLTTAIETKLGGGFVAAYQWPGRLADVGVENLRCESAISSTNPKDEDHAWFAVTMENVQDGWVRQLTGEHFAGSLVAIYETCKQVTVQDCASLAPVSEIGGYRRHTFFTMGQMTLFVDCYAEFGRHDFSVGNCAAGPNAFVQCHAAQPFGDSGAIESWASGVLYDCVTIDGNGLSLTYRGANPLGAGWSAANSVLWQCSASVIRCANPPGARNWSLGCWGEFEGNGIWRNSNESVRPYSLFVAQLQDRLGESARGHVKLLLRSMEESSNPTIAQAAVLIAASHQPAPQLVDYIAAAPSRFAIASEAGTAKRVEELAATKPSAAPHLKRLALTNGWLVCDGQLVAGRKKEVPWWRGNIRPAEAAQADPDVTRFVPGRVGPGFTDDLEALARSLHEQGIAVLDHHYGLWYERRRDDHERVRRINGDVWPPFYEMPFDRTGQSTAWNGLSLYDLTKPNPWYWSRLKEFAVLCEQYGLVLFHQNYFQHNILEAGAHWADAPWRSTNNVNATGFPEPPPYAGDKRIFVADQFYDETNPVRRKLHQGYIRQCLENFADTPNVIQFTSDEYTGPLHFTQFWLDTIAEWERKSGHKELIGLSCTKDGQDAILADAKRSKMVDVIDFKYWFASDRGTFAPKGGQNLSPRQFERQWKGGRLTERNLAQMAAEYRQRCPGKAITAEYSQGGWAYLCAGGSLPNIPQGTDGKLLAAVPRMQPWSEASGANRWVLSERGEQYLVYLGSGASSQLDLSAAPGSFQVWAVDSETGSLSDTNQKLKGGAVVQLPDASSILWLVREP